MNDYSPNLTQTGPGSAILFAYIMFTIWGIILGTTLGWFIWA